jgi:hypothetical protein
VGSGISALLRRWVVFIHALAMIQKDFIIELVVARV